MPWFEIRTENSYSKILYYWAKRFLISVWNMQWIRLRTKTSLLKYRVFRSIIMALFVGNNLIFVGNMTCIEPRTEISCSEVNYYWVKRFLISVRNIQWIGSRTKTSLLKYRVFRSIIMTLFVGNNLIFVWIMTCIEPRTEISFSEIHYYWAKRFLISEWNKQSIRLKTKTSSVKYLQSCTFLNQQY